MAIEITVQPLPRAWLEHSILQPYVLAYGDHLRSGRYAPSTQRVYLCCVAHFAHWLTSERYELPAVDEKAAARFVAEHLPNCACPYPVRRLVYEIRAAIVRLLEVLRADGAIHSSGLAVDDDLGQELARFDDHMHDVCGLARSTREQRLRIVGSFLSEQFGSRPIIPSAIKSDALRRFILDAEDKRSAGTINVIGGAIACYLRFRGIGGDPTADLLAAIPRAAHWRLAPLPEVLSETEIEQLLGSFDRPFPSFRRAYAMVRCLTDLGLRSSEVAKLRLDDINWHEGTVSLAATKTRRTDILPLPTETGRAIAAYLRDERPQTLDRAVFVRHVAPFDTPIEKTVVKRAVEAAYRRCGWTRSGVHILRHSVASRLLRAGTPMKNIADILRHRSLDTSAIYAKVDLGRLAAVALPWPGSAS
jgi:integrase